MSFGQNLGSRLCQKKWLCGTSKNASFLAKHSDGTLLVVGRKRFVKAVRRTLLT